MSNPPTSARKSGPGLIIILPSVIVAVGLIAMMVMRHERDDSTAALKEQVKQAEAAQAKIDQNLETQLEAAVAHAKDDASRAAAQAQLDDLRRRMRQRSAGQ
jgi:hypothetical protein